MKTLIEVEQLKCQMTCLHLGNYHDDEFLVGEGYVYLVIYCKEWPYMCMLPRMKKLYSLKDERSNEIEKNLKVFVTCIECTKFILSTYNTH